LKKTNHCIKRKRNHEIKRSCFLICRSLHVFVDIVLLNGILCNHPIQVNAPVHNKPRHALVCVYPTILPTSSIHQSNIPRPLLALRNPPIDHCAIPNLQSHLERLAIHRKSVRHLVAAETVEDRLVAGFLRRQDLEGDDAAEEGGVEFAVGEVGADAPARNGLVTELWRMGWGLCNGLTSDSQLPAHNAACPSSQTHHQYSYPPNTSPG
jgi:predicted transcriptional regulator